MSNRPFPALFPLGFGASPLGSVFGTVSQKEADEAIGYALDNGVNFIDVAPYYGETRAETVLGNALSDIERSRYVLASKVGRYTSNGFDFSYNRVLQSIDESLSRLKTDYIDLMQCHDIEFVEEAIIHDEALPALRHAREQGKVRFIGITGLPVTYLQKVAEKESDLDCVLSYCHLTLSDDALLTELSELKARGLTVINASPMAMGLLADRTLPAWHPAPVALRTAANQAAEYCRQQGTSLARIALQYSLIKSVEYGIATTLTGMAHIDEVRQNLKWAAEGSPDPEILQAVLNIFAPVKNMTWPTGLPENC